jgi:cell division protein FtsW
LIFVPLAEELGFIGGTAILSTFVLLLGVGFRLANGASSEFDSIVTIGMTIFLASQTWSSIAVALQLLPPAGHSLPFISLNGAALVVGYTGLALLLKISEGIPFVPDKTQLLPQIRLSNRSPS